MNLYNALNINPYKKKTMLLPFGQMILLFILLSVGIFLILSTITTAAINSILLFSFVSFVGLFLCQKTQKQLNDESLSILGYFWLIKLGMTLFLLYMGWIPQLDPATSSSWGYDPQRYYVQSQTLIENHWSSASFGMNYMGILYYYGAIFFMLGHNPVIPALINAFLTLIASLYLVRAGYEIKDERNPKDWTLALCLLLPELLWFDVMTSRESVLMFLLSYVMLTTGRFLIRKSNISIFHLLIVTCLSGLLIAAVRPIMLFPMTVSIVLMVLLVRPKDGLIFKQKNILYVIAFITFIIGPIVNDYLGGYHYGIIMKLQNAFLAKDNIALSPYLSAGWSKNSIGLILMPENFIEAFVFMFPRMILYWIAPLPRVFVPIHDLMIGSYSAWQALFVMFSSVINILIMPFVLASLLQSIKRRKVDSAPLVFHISYWLVFITVAGGNLIICERYRVMATLLLWGCAWLGVQTCSKKLVFQMSIVWYGLLSIGALFYMEYKFNLL